MGKPKAETRIKREREKLAEVFAKMDENKRKTAENSWITRLLWP